MNTQLHTGIMPWYLPRTNIDQTHAISFIQNPRQHEKQTVETIQKEIQQHNTHPLLFQLVHSILNTPKSKQRVSALMELFAGLAYANTNKKSGRLHMIRSGMKHCNPEVRGKIVPVFRSKINQLSPSNQSMWFTLRSACVDLYVATLFGVPRLKDIIFYGGENHVQNIQSYLHALGAEEIKESDPLHILEFTNNHSLHTVVQYKYKDKVIGLIGENHGETNKNFADAFLAYMRNKCNIDPNEILTILLEKHFTRDKTDTVQCTLMCNQPNTALHRLRCDSFIDSNGCTSLRILSVDNRHYDLGFLRGEFLDTWHSVRPQAEEFQKQIKTSILEHVEKFNSS